MPGTRDRDPNALLPLTPAMFHVLVAMADGDRHGYAIIKDVAERTSGDVALSTGTLYGILKRVLAEGLAIEGKRPAAATTMSGAGITGSPTSAGASSPPKRSGWRPWSAPPVERGRFEGCCHDGATAAQDQSAVRISASPSSGRVSG
jgi:hypothetical protein